MATDNTNDSDGSFISELWEFIMVNPPGIDARVLLMQCYHRLGWHDDAKHMAEDILLFDPGNTDATRHLYEGTSGPDTVTRCSPSTVSSSNPSSTRPRDPHPVPRNGREQAILADEFSQRYEIVRAEARQLLLEARFVQAFHQQGTNRHSENDQQIENSRIEDLKLITEGGIWNVVATARPRSALTIARAVAAEQREDRVLDMIVDDLDGMIRWIRKTENELSRDGDEIREAVQRRVRVMTAALPPNLRHWPSIAFMHVEHEQLQKTYLNDETMYGDKIADIPRANFWVSEDGYAWDMSELASCLAATNGVMRNPLSRQIFSPGDVKSILQHPLGKPLAALQVEQSNLRQGVRPAALRKLEELASVMMDDMSQDQAPSRNQLDEFLAYMATLPETEQRAIDTLRVPAVDSHTGQPFDGAIGEFLRDAKANRTCLHKTADFIRQAVQHLRRSSST
ncbi:uncharacterized protein Z518_03207 [Rhinocladiella mackenziei CBS 650.93]|uniref:Rhinocladiella mackenziei CBS 650.93 unplaced genomic scaffold supercont1.2, whole genome shotgun sequence n=1 Tax=Rhinocladiella mackenziei CBS 650.93 TaxID=1442369 RepID=A0A0D2IYW2_9EURO|nr:uncharacterized protein Z518_03207 [Rhinocladiella mackenziei CBS 650.93]KIX08551.1 hypothetical protein Z518_03207 [Rhinocladiella mackenziei CBS 650.93]